MTKNGVSLNVARFTAGALTAALLPVLLTFLSACNNGSSTRPASTPAPTLPTASTAALPPTPVSSPANSGLPNSGVAGATTVPVNGPATINWTEPPVSDEAVGFDPVQLLQGQGEWIVIGQERYFQPTLAPEDRDWQPYQHGAWTYDVERGWTWSSYDRWGKITDHYGVWRHHGQHKWVWLPLPDHRYRPHTVTWFDQGDYVGWYPLYNEYPEIYRADQRLGFDDGYWHGVQAVTQAANAGVSFQIGFTLISRRQVTGANIFEHCVRDNALVLRVAILAHAPALVRQPRFGQCPGGEPKRAYEFLQGRAGSAAPVGRVTLVEIGHGQRLLQPVAQHELPAREKRRLEALTPAHPAVAQAAVPVAPGTPPVAPADQGPHQAPPPNMRRGEGGRITPLPGSVAPVRQMPPVPDQHPNVDPQPPQGKLTPSTPAKAVVATSTSPKSKVKTEAAPAPAPAPAAMKQTAALTTAAPAIPATTQTTVPKPPPAPQDVESRPPPPPKRDGEGRTTVRTREHRQISRQQDADGADDQQPDAKPARRQTKIRKTDS